jgi:hypothetical protein
MAATDQGLLSLGPKDGVSSWGLWPSPLRLDRKRLSCVLGAWVINSLPSWPAWRMADSEGVSLSSRSCVAIDQYRNRAGSTAVREWPWAPPGPTRGIRSSMELVGSRWPGAGCRRSFRQHRPGSPTPSKYLVERRAPASAIVGFLSVDWDFRLLVSRGKRPELGE